MAKPKRNNKNCPVCKRIKDEVESAPDNRGLQDILMAHYKKAHKLYGKWYPQ